MKHKVYITLKPIGTFNCDATVVIPEGYYIYKIRMRLEISSTGGVFSKRTIDLTCFSTITDRYVSIRHLGTRDELYGRAKRVVELLFE